jgi:RHS repeat-associated protein
MSAHYIYDGLRRRILKDVDGTVTRYVYDNEDIILELGGAGTQLAYYTHGRGIDEPISMVRGGSTYYYVTDALGSIVALTDDAGVVVNEYIYDSFGNMVYKVEGVTNPYTYTGREWDAESSLYYYRIRYYDPGTGRFLNQDPLGFSQGPNFYTYTGNNPTLFTDSFGLWLPSGHETLTREAMGGFHDYMTDITVAANLHIDRGENFFNSPQHYFPGTAVKANKWIWSNIGLALESSNLTSSLTYLGYALHTVQDKWSHYMPNKGYIAHAIDYLLNDVVILDVLEENPHYAYEARLDTEYWIDKYKNFAKAIKLWLPGKVSWWE